MQRLYSNINAILPRLEIENIDISQQIIKYNDKEIRFSFVNHHFAHIGMSYYTSPYNKSAIFISDGYGENVTMILAVADGDKIEILKEHKFPHSLGMFYATMTEFCGFEPEKDEWKLMGASAYGDESKYYKELRSLITINDGGLELDLNYFNFYNFDSKGMYTQKLIDLLDGECTYLDDEQKMYDIAASSQKVYEDIATELLDWLYVKSGQFLNICLGGGTAMNGLFNGKIKTLSKFEEVYIPFAPDDMGNSIGAVLYKNKLKLPYLESYLGDCFTNNFIEEVLNKFKLSYRYYKCDDLNKFIAKEISNGKIVGWFQGKMEFGQRALGNRSILANPCDENMKSRLNSAIKFREGFRPFAPAILEEYAEEYFENYSYTPYMEKIFYFKDKALSKVPSVVHNDKTGRLQSVSKKTNEKFYNLIEEFYNITGVPILINTSFNVSGEPVVCTPEDAIRTFFTSGLDILVLENFIIKKDSNDT
jgi:carbamoyltransferase